jgi:glutathione S-transferase
MASVKTILSPHIMQRIRQLFDNVNANRMQNRPESDKRLLQRGHKYEGPMQCAEPEILGLATQWSFWAMLETEALLLDLLQHRAVLPEFARDASYAERDELLLTKPLGVLNGALAGHDYLAGNSFTVADLNVASILVWGKMGRLNLSNQPQVARWFDACLARPAYGRVRERASRK